METVRNECTEAAVGNRCNDRRRHQCHEHFDGDGCNGKRIGLTSSGIWKSILRMRWGTNNKQDGSDDDLGI